MRRHDFLKEVLRLYTLAPDTPEKPSRRDWAIAGHLYQRGVPLETVAHTIRLTALRRCFRDQQLGPLEPIHSLAYYRRAIEQLDPLALDPGFVDYIRWKYQRAFPDLKMAVKRPTYGRL